MFLNARLSDEEVKRLFSIDDNENWEVAKVREAMRGEKYDPVKIVDVCYGPFDFRKLYLDRRLVFRPRLAITQPLMLSNIALIVNRIARERSTALVADVPVGHKAASRYDPNYVFPLFRYDGGSAAQENLEPKFRDWLDSRYEEHYTPEEILGYVYAVLHAPTYCIRYTEFLRIDFPRIPFPESASDFETLSELGWALVQAHLLRELPRKKLASYHGKGDHAVEAVRYVPADEALAINKTQFFKPVPQAVWEFHIGGYQVLDKYLKSRKGRTLSLDEINHVGAIADSLAFTIEQMGRIDAAYRAAFPDGG